MTPEPQFEPSNTVSGAPNVVVVVCVCPPKVTKQFPAIPGVWRHCPQYLMAALAAEDDVHTTERHPNRIAQFAPNTVSARCWERRKWLWRCVCPP